jgi:hypothetical protein
MLALRLLLGADYYCRCCLLLILRMGCAAPVEQARHSFCRTTPVGGLALLCCCRCCRWLLILLLSTTAAGADTAAIWDCPATGLILRLLLVVPTLLPLLSLQHFAVGAGSGVGSLLCLTAVDYTGLVGRQKNR